MTKIDGWTAPGYGGVAEAFRFNFDTGSEVGAAFSAYHHGEKVVDLWGGVADARRDRPWEEDTLVLVFSTTKGVVAMCANRLAQEGLLDPDAPVVTYWPEFAQAGKDSITVTDLLAHRAGLTWVDGTMSFDDMVAWDPVVRALESQAPHWEPGTAHGYHATTYGWLVGEVIRRITGRSVGTYLRQAITEPLGASFFIGLPADLHRRAARLLPFGAQLPGTAGADATGEGDSFDMASIVDLLGADSPLVKALTAPGGSLTDQDLWNSPRLFEAEIPAANGICDARSLALLYAACMGEVEDADGKPFRILEPAQLDRALVQESEGPDRTLLDLDIQWGLGFMLNRGIVGEAGLGGPRSFGHFGMGGSSGWADPDLDLGMGYVMNRMDIGTTGDTRSFRLMQACIEVARASD